MSHHASWCLFHSSDILIKDKLKGFGAGGDQDDAHAMAGAYSSSEHESDRELGTEMADGTTRAERKVEKAEKRKYTPYRFSGKSYSFDYHQERVLVDSLRTWQDHYFSRSSWVFKSKSKLLGKLKEEASRHSESYEFDLLVKVLKIFEKDEYNLELRIKDTSNELWFIVIPKLKFGPLKEGDIIRIRSVTVEITPKRNLLACKPSTNILRFTYKNPIV